MSMDKNRRTLLKLALIGGGLFIVGKVLSPILSKFSTESEEKAEGGSVQNFTMVKNDKNISVLDEKGEQIFEIDNSQ